MNFSKINSENTYSVISATYNVEKYLNDYFQSIIKQSINFEKHIHLILVDDGSIDNSAKIIHKWRKKYPNNITYIKKQNGGQASARNLGLDYIKTEWVTFIDPDDFINRKYFEKVDKTVRKYQDSDLAMIGCNIQYYFEKLKLYLDRHPLRYKFISGNTNYIIKNLNENIQLSASAAFFRTDLINKTQLKFDEKIKPNFEDAHFVNTYLVENYNSSISFLKDAKYYYRRRRVKNSTIDTSWQKKELFDDVLNFGCLNLFEKAKNDLGYIPKFLQKTILYHLSWYYKYIVDKPEFITFLNKEQKSTFSKLLKKNFDNIELNTIETFDLSGIDDFIKSGWANIYKQTSLSSLVIYITRESKKLELYYYSNTEKSLTIQIDGFAIDLPKPLKIEHTFLDDKFINQYQFEIPLTKTMKKLSIQSDVNQTYLKTNKNEYLSTINIKDIQTKRMKDFHQLLYNTAHKIILGN